MRDAKLTSIHRRDLQVFASGFSFPELYKNSLWDGSFWHFLTFTQQTISQVQQLNSSAPSMLPVLLAATSKQKEPFFVSVKEYFLLITGLYTGFYPFKGLVLIV